jgi:O-antigen ligase
MKSENLQVCNHWIWAVLLVVLPITSSPLIARSFGGSSVAPLALVPLVILVFTFLAPYILNHKAIPRPAVPLLFFVLFAVFSIAVSSFIQIPSFRGLVPPKNNLKDLLTLAAGICFYLTAIFAVHDLDSLRFSLRWLNVGGIVMILFAVIQLITWRIANYYPEWIRNLQDLISISGKLYDNRVTGLALEPSWLAHQLNVLYLPIWLAFTVHGSTIYKKRFFNFTIENLLLLAGLFTLAATLSRIGWLSGGGLLIYLLIRGANNWKNRLVGVDRPHSRNKIRKISFSILFWFVIILTISLLGFSGVKLLSLLDPKRMASVFALFDFQRYGLLEWANRLEMAERFLYWMSAFSTFQAYPLFGVGLGNVGYFFLQNLAAFGYGSPEIMQHILFNTTLVNAKNLWARLLAETGIVGFACFITWVYDQLRISISLEKATKRPFFKAMGLAGILITISLIIEGFSMDTFGLPYYWIGFGLVIGAYRLSQNLTVVPAVNN